VVAWRDMEGALDVEDAVEKLGAAIRAVLDLSNLSAIPREKQPEPSKPGGTPLFA
jgi:2,4-dichlorophenol 6-monooxygenase